MARKKGGSKKDPTSGKKSDSKRAKKDTGSQKTRGSGLEYDFMNTWVNFQEDMGKQIADVIQNQQEYHKDLNKKWLDMSGEITKKMTNSLPSDDAQAELQRTWERYMNEMKVKMDRFLNTELEAYDSLHDKWKPLSEEMTKAVMAMGTAKNVRQAQERLLRSWMDISREITTQMTKSIHLGTEEFKGLRVTWSNLLQDMGKVAKEMQDTNPEMADGLKVWDETTKKVNTLFMSQMDTDLEELTRRQTFWMQTMSDMSANFVKTVWDMNLKMFEKGMTEMPGRAPKRK
jgi:hypothetical protein